MRAIVESETAIVRGVDDLEGMEDGQRIDEREGRKKKTSILFSVAMR
jgi:hypothetical protein